MTAACRAALLRHVPALERLQPWHVLHGLCQNPSGGAVPGTAASAPGRTAGRRYFSDAAAAEGAEGQPSQQPAAAATEATEGGSLVTQVPAPADAPLGLRTVMSSRKLWSRQATPVACACSLVGRPQPLPACRRAVGGPAQTAGGAASPPGGALACLRSEAARIWSRDDTWAPPTQDILAWCSVLGLRLVLPACLTAVPHLALQARQGRCCAGESLGAAQRVLAQALKHHGSSASVWQLHLRLMECSVELLEGAPLQLAGLWELGAREPGSWHAWQSAAQAGVLQVPGPAMRLPWRPSSCEEGSRLPCSACRAAMHCGSLQPAWQARTAGRGLLKPCRPA